VDIWKNRNGKCFIFLRYTGKEEGLFVTPIGEIKSLEMRLFEKATSKDEEEITELQANRYHEYMRQEKDYGSRRKEFGTQRAIALEFGKRITLEQAAQFNRDIEEFYNKKKRREILKRKF
jgi:hypothetical protein